MKQTPLMINGVTQLDDIDFNQARRELENLITTSGQTLASASSGAGSDNTQIAKAVANYVCDGNFFAAGGTATSITLSAHDSRALPTQYVTGQKFRFIAAADNTNVNTYCGFSSLGLLKVANGNPTTATSGTIGIGSIRAGKLYELVVQEAQDSNHFLQIGIVTLDQVAYGELDVSNDGKSIKIDSDNGFSISASGGSSRHDQNGFYQTYGNDTINTEQGKITLEDTVAGEETEVSNEGVRVGTLLGNNVIAKPKGITYGRASSTAFGDVTIVESRKMTFYYTGVTGSDWTQSADESSIWTCPENLDTSVPFSTGTPIMSATCSFVVSGDVVSTPVSVQMVSNSGNTRITNVRGCFVSNPSSGTDFRLHIEMSVQNVT